MSDDLPPLSKFNNFVVKSSFPRRGKPYRTKMFTSKHLSKEAKMFTSKHLSKGTFAMILNKSMQNINFLFKFKTLSEAYLVKIFRYA